MSKLETVQYRFLEVVFQAYYFVKFLLRKSSNNHIGYE